MATPPTVVDLRVDTRWIVPVEPPDALLASHSVLVADGAIVDVLPTELAAGRYRAREHVSLPEHLLIPGLINLHTHAATALLRGVDGNASPPRSPCNFAADGAMRVLSAEFVYDGTLLACAEMLRGGVTCFNDMYFFPEAAARAALASGMRAALGVIALEARSPYGNDANDYLGKGLALRDSLRGEPRLSFCLAPLTPNSVSDATLGRIAVFAGELDAPVHIRLHETHGEIRESMTAHGQRPLQRLRNLGLLGPGLIAAHAVHLAPEEIDLLAAHGCHVAHCPTSNLKLSRGIAPVPALLQRGVNVGLGTGGAPGNDRFDVLGEMRLAAMLARAAGEHSKAIAAQTAIDMATLASARALALDARVGSLAAGKRADMVAINLDALELAPCHDPLQQLIYAAGREHVTHVWIDGQLLVKNGALTGLDSREIVAKAAVWKEKIARRA